MSIPVSVMRNVCQAAHGKTLLLAFFLETSKNFKSVHDDYLP